MAGILYIISTPIGNYNDLTFRAIRILSETDFLICEEFNIGKRLLNYLKLEKEIILVNEHTEKVNSDIIIQMLLSGMNGSLISDAGTPVFSDPGCYLINLAYQSGVKVSAIPGADSLIPSLVLSGFDISKFYYAGWLSPKSEKRQLELRKLTKLKEIIVIMETPYRVKQLLKDVSKILGIKTPIVLACDLTTENEKIIRGTVLEVIDEIEKLNKKFEFVLIIDNKSTHL